MGNILKIFTNLFKKLKLSPFGAISNFISFALGMIISDIIQPAMRPLKFANEKLHKSNIISLDEAIRVYFKGNMSLNQLYDIGSSYGFSSKQVDIMIKANEQVGNVGDVQSLYVRGEINEQEAVRRITKQGFSNQWAKEFLTLASYIPTVPDFIRMSVREVFTEETRRKYGLDEDYPTVLTDLVKKAGLDVKYAKDYWAAHWELPSISQGYDMYHRGIISKDEVILLLKSLDVMPYWRDKVLKLSESPFTRVDVRRMFQLGVLSFEEVVKAYKDLGYSSEKATKLAEFTAKDVQEENKELTKSEVLACYNDGLLSDEQLADYLSSMGYSQEEGELLLTMSKSKKIRKFTNRFISNIKDCYLKEEITKNDVIVALNSLNLPGSVVDETIFYWDLERIPKSKYPTKAETLKWFKAGRIEEEEATAMLRNIGYADKWIEQYLEDTREKMEGGE